MIGRMIIVGATLVKEALITVRKLRHRPRWGDFVGCGSWSKIPRRKWKGGGTKQNVQKEREIETGPSKGWGAGDKV